MPNTIRRALATALVILGSAAAAACDNPVAVEEHDEEEHEHAEPERVRIRFADQVVATAGYQQGSAEGEIGLVAGSTVTDVVIEFLAEDGDVLETEDEDYLELELADPAVATFTPTEPGGFTGRIEARADGETTATLRLMHGELGEGHPDFISTPIRVVVRGPA